MFACNAVLYGEGAVAIGDADLSTTNAEEGIHAVVHGPAKCTAGVDASAELAGFLRSSQIFGRLIQNSLEVFNAGVVVAPLVQRCLGILDPGVACELCDLSHDEPAAALAAQALPAGQIVDVAVGVAMDFNNVLAENVNDALTIRCEQIVERHQVAVSNVLRLVDQPAGPCKVNALTGSQNLGELLAVLFKRNVNELNGGVGNVLLELLIESGPDLVGVGLLAGAGDHELNGLLLKRGLGSLFGSFRGFGVVGGFRRLSRGGGFVRSGSLSSLAAARQNDAQNHDHGKEQANGSLFHDILLRF